MDNAWWQRRRRPARAPVAPPAGPVAPPVRRLEVNDWAWRTCDDGPVTAVDKYSKDSWAVWRPGLTGARRRRWVWRPRLYGAAAALAALTAGATGLVTLPGIWGNLAGIFGCLAAILAGAVGHEVSAFDVGANLAARLGERPRHGRDALLFISRQVAGSGEAIEETAAAMASALFVIHHSRARAEGWLDDESLHHVHEVVFDAMRQLHATVELRTTLTAAAEYPDLAAQRQPHTTNLADFDRQFTAIATDLVGAAPQVQHLDRQLDAEDDRARRSAERDRLSAKLAAGTANTLNPTSRAEARHAAEAITTRLDAIAELRHAAIEAGPT